ncbi:MAG: hypothetical protein ACFB4I_15730 [Cyanophyceae cyanobacterium]
MKTNYSIYNTEPLNLGIESEVDIGSRLGDRTYQYPRHTPYSLPRSHRQNRVLRSSTRKECAFGQELCPVLGGQESSQVTQRSLGNRCAKLSQRQPPRNNWRSECCVELAQIHLDTIRRNLERRLQVAKRNQKNSLVTLLEREFQQLNCSPNVGKP